MKNLIHFLPILFLFACSTSGVSERSPDAQTTIMGENVLYIGDSISAGPLGLLVYNHLSEKVGADGKVNLYGIVSSSPRHWAPSKKTSGAKWLCKQKGRKNKIYPTNVSKDVCPKRRKDSPISHLVKHNDPSLVIFQFLGNSMGMSESAINRNIQSLLDQTPQARCIFITSAPYHDSINHLNEKRLETANNFIKAINGRCEVFNGMSSERLHGFRKQRGHYAGDKKHLSSAGAKAFFEELKELL
jgi:hypothetical protein